MVIASRTRDGVEVSATVGHAAAAPPGLGPGVRRTATARGLTLRTRPQLAQVSIDADPAEAAHRADDGELVLVAGRSGASRTDRSARRAGSRAGRREDRLAVGVELGDPRALLEGDLRARLADLVDERCRAR